jgi:hypothetical protein
MFRDSTSITQWLICGAQVNHAQKALLGSNVVFRHRQSRNQKADTRRTVSHAWQNMPNLAEATQRCLAQYRTCEPDEKVAIKTANPWPRLRRNWERGEEWRGQLDP